MPHISLEDAISYQLSVASGPLVLKFTWFPFSGAAATTTAGLVCKQKERTDQNDAAIPAEQYISWVKFVYRLCVTQALEIGMWSAKWGNFFVFLLEYSCPALKLAPVVKTVKYGVA